MNTYKVTLQYKGTFFYGWQIQPEERTVQGELNKALVKISKSSEIKSMGSGRTDRGVHALNQVVKIEIPLLIEVDQLKRGLNSLLPDDIQVLKVENCNETFHPVMDAKWKEYQYLFSSDKELSLFHKDYISIRPYELDLEAMRRACELFVGKHDFADFMCVGTPVNSTIREIFECELKTFDKQWGIFPETKNILTLRVRGNGFLKQMVRLMMGTVWNIGQSKTSLEQLSMSLSSPSGEKLGAVAPAQGLYLAKVFYP